MTSKLQVTVPKAIAEQFSIRPGDEIDWIPAGDGVRVVKRAPARRAGRGALIATRLRQFDETTKRLQSRVAGNRKDTVPAERGWTREELYRRGGSD